MSRTFGLRHFRTLLSRSCRIEHYRFLSIKAAMSESSAPKGIDATPTPGQLIEHEGVIYNTIREGLAHILVPPNARTETDPKAAKKGQDGSEQVQSVFYNPIQQFNRDLSVLAIKAFGEDVMARRRQKSERTRAKKDKKRETRERGEDTNSKRRKGNDGFAVAAEKETPTEQKTDEPVVEGAAQETADASVTEQPEVQASKEGQDEAAPQAPAQSDEMDIDKAPQTNGTNNTEPQRPAQPSQPSGPKFRILDALSATGLRALRYAHEIPFATSVVSNDMLPAAVESIALNVRHNKQTSKITPSTGNAIGHMYQAAFATPGSSSEAWAQGKYDVVDLDPYGTAVPFLDAAIQSLNDGGLLCVTCTDAGVFASCGYVEKTYSLYGGLPIKGPHSHEAGLRLILNSIATAAGKYGIAIEPLLSLSIDYYARVFVRVKKSPADVKFLAGKTMLVHQCDAGCGAWQTQYLARHAPQANRTNFKHGAAQSSGEKLCPHCGFKTHVAGPMWGGAMHNPFFIQRILESLPKVDKDIYQTTLRIEGMLTSALDELDVLPETALEAQESTDAPFIPAMPSHAIDPFPFFFIPSAVAKVLHCQAPGEAPIKGALRKAGFMATRSHTKPGTIKTNASWEMVWEVMREWVRQKAPLKGAGLSEKQSGYKILQLARKSDVVESAKEGAAVTEGEKVENGDSVKTVPTRSGSPPREDVKSFKIVFDEALGKDHTGKKLMRYQVNPRDNWGMWTEPNYSEKALLTI